MANTLRFKRGLVAGIPNGALGEPLFTTDTFDLYIGNGTGNTRFQKYIASGTTSQLLRGDGSLLTMPIVLTSPSNGQVLKYNGTNWVNDSDAGITGSGTTNYLPKFTGASTLGNSLVVETGGGIDVVRAGDVVLGLTATASGSTSLYLTPNGGGFGQLSVLGSAHLRLGTNGTERARFTAGGNFLVGGTSDNGLRFQVTGDGYFSGSVGIGTTGLSNTNLNITKNLTGSTNTYGIFNSGSIRSDVTTGAQMFTSAPSIQNAVFTLAGLKHFEAVGISSVGSATITSQFGFYVESLLTGATNNYGFFGNIASGTGRWNLYMNGSALNYLNGALLIGSTSSTGQSLQVTGTAIVSSTMTAGSFNGTTNNIFSTGGTEQMRLNSSGQLGLGAIPYGWGGSYKAFDFLFGSIANTNGGNVDVAITQNAFFNGTNWISKYTGASKRYVLSDGGHIWFNGASATSGTAITMTQAMTLFATGNLAVGSTSDAGFRLDVNGTMRVSGAATFSSSVTSASLNVNSGGAYISGFRGGLSSPNAGQLYYGADNTGWQFSIGKLVSSTYTAQMVFKDNSTVTTTSDFIIAGGYGLDFINGSGNTVTAMRSTAGGTSIMSSTSTGTHIAVGTEAASDLILASNNTERIRLSSNGFFSQINATNPSASITDSYIQYSADVTAGNAAPHFRTENGAVIKLYQETTGVGNAIFSQGGGNSVLDDSTFDGYTLRQIVKALRNQGILA